MGRPQPPADPVIVGRVARPHGIAGEVVVEPESGHSASFEPGAELWTGERWMTVLQARPDRRRWCVRFDAAADRDAAEALRGIELWVEADRLQALEAGEFYVHDLVGCRVERPDGRGLGTVRAVISGPRDWLEVEHQGRTTLLPMARDLLHAVDLEARRIVVEVPEGLIETTAH